MKRETLDDEDGYKKQETIELERMEDESANDGLEEEMTETYEELEFVPLNSKKFNVCILNVHVFWLQWKWVQLFHDINCWVVSAPINSIVGAYWVEWEVAREDYHLANVLKKFEGSNLKFSFRIWACNRTLSFAFLSWMYLWDELNDGLRNGASNLKRNFKFCAFPDYNIKKLEINYIIKMTMLL